MARAIPERSHHRPACPSLMTGRVFEKHPTLCQVVTATSTSAQQTNFLGATLASYLLPDAFNRPAGASSISRESRTNGATELHSDMSWECEKQWPMLHSHSLKGKRNQMLHELKRKGPAGLGPTAGTRQQAKRSRSTWAPTRLPPRGSCPSWLEPSIRISGASAVDLPSA